MRLPFHVPAVYKESAAPIPCHPGKRPAALRSFFPFFSAATQVSMATQILFNPCERSSPSQLSVCSLKAKRMPRIQLPHNNNVPIEAGAERGQSILVSLAPWLEGGG